MWLKWLFPNCYQNCIKCMQLDFANVCNTVIVFMPVFNSTLDNDLKRVLAGFLAHWAAAKLHRFTVICFCLFIFSPYFFSVFDFFLILLVLVSISPLCWLPLLVVASDLSAPKKCRARFGLDQQNNWCGPCRCVWCVLALARARWRLGNSMLGLPPPALCCFSSSSRPSLSVPPGYSDLSASSSHVLPVYLWVFTIWF